MDVRDLFVLVRRLFADRYSTFDMRCLVCVTERVMQRLTVPVKLSCPGLRVQARFKEDGAITSLCSNSLYWEWFYK
jgi:hypothetical protein